MAVTGMAQESTRPFQHLTLKDGLPNPSVLDVQQDRQGFMWFATFTGIVRYDGYSMQTYYPELAGPDTIPLRNLPTLGEGPDGDMLVGYALGDCKLFRYDPALDRLQPYLYDTLERRSLIPLTDGVKSLYTDSRGWLWIGTMGIGVFVVKGEEIVHYKYDLNDPSSSRFPTPDVLGDMVEDEAGNIWMPTFDGLCKWEAATDEFTFFPFSEKDVAYPNQSYSLYFSPPHTLWVGSTYEGLLRFDIERETFRRYPLPLEDEVGAVFINELSMLPNGKLALATSRSERYSGILQFDPATEQWTTLESQDNIFGYENANYVDRAGNLWIAGWQRGILKYDPNRDRFRRWNPALLRSGEVVNAMPISLAEAHDGTIFIGTAASGLFAWDPQTGDYRRYPMSENEANPGEERAVYSVHEAQPGALWLGVDDRARYFVPGTGRAESLSFSWQGQPIENFSLRRTGKDQYWLSSWRFGFCELEATAPNRLSVQRCFHHAASDSLGALEAITELVAGPRGKIWIGSNQYGLYIFDPETGRFDHHLPQYGVWGIHFDRTGLAWLATHSSGLKGYDSDRRLVIHLDAETHEAMGLTHGILEDRHGMLWLINDRGLVQFDPVTRQVKRHISAANWRSVSESGYHRDQPALKTRSGAMVFGERHGAVYFHPDSLLLDTLPPLLAFTDFKLFNESVALGPDSPLSQHISRTPAIELEHWQNDISVQFAALHFKNPAEYRYRYRLLPGNEDWIDIGNRNEVFFTGLAPNDYTLWVQAANADGAWNEEGIRLQMTVLRPWWKRYWAFGLYGLLLLSAGYGVYRFQLGRRLRESENRRLKELDAFKNRVFTNITHEFRTPLTIILGLADQVRSRVARMFHADLTHIEQQGRRLLRLVNRMLDLAQLEAGQLHLEPLQSDIHFFLRYVTQAFKSLARDKQQELHWEIPEEPFVMDFDPTRLEQVVTNLLSNAIKFTPAGGSVRLSGGPTDHDTYRIEVADTGPGIAPELREQVFHRFFRSADAESRPPLVVESPTEGDQLGTVNQGEGSGIGLALCRELVQLMGGSIALDSEPGGGARFTVELPVTRQAPLRKLPLQPPVRGTAAELAQEIPEPVAALDAEAPDERDLVLVVEDHAALRTYLRGCLEDQFRVVEAENGRQGWEQALELTPDLIVSDVMMPEMDGFELCRRVKEDRRTSHIPVVLLTARVDVPSRLAGRRHGADAYLTKPFVAEELRLVARNQLAHRQRLQAYYQSLFAGQSVAPAAAAEEPAPEAAFVTEVRQYLLAHLDDTDLNVEGLAAALHMSRVQLYRKIKSLAGITPVALIRQVRLEQAKVLLRTTELQVAEVAYHCGYSDPGFFGRVFREEVGMTPGEWREG